MLALAAAPTLLTIAAEWSGAAATSNAIRAAAAVPLGSTVGWVLVRMLRAESEPGACAMII